MVSHCAGVSGPDEDVIGPEGMEKFCEDIGVEPENVRIQHTQPTEIFHL